MVERPLPFRLSVRAWVFLLPCALLLSSCSNGLVPVRGQVLHKGNPIKGAVVFFHPAKVDANAQTPSAVTGEDGTFTLTTGKESGAPAGKYTVTVVWYKEVPPPTKMSMEPPPDAPDQLKGQYADPKKSKIQVEITSSTTQLEPFRLE